MKVKALINIRHNGKLYKKGEDFEISEKDMKKIEDYIEVQKEKVKDPEDEFSKMNKDELVEYFISATGQDLNEVKKLKVDELRQKIREHENGL